MPCAACPAGPGCRGEIHRRWCDRLDEPKVRDYLEGMAGTRVVTRPAESTGRVATADALVMLAHANAHTGYGIHARHQARQLERLGVPVRIEAVNRSDSFIPVDPWVADRLVDPDDRPKFVTKASGGHELREHETRDHVIYTMWESSRLHPQTVTMLNLARAVVVPCRWNEQVFRSSGVTAPLHVVPLGIDPEVYKPGPPEPADRVMFLTAGRVAHGGARKGIDDVIAAFLAEFADEHAAWLTVKLWPDCAIPDPGHPPIILNRDPLSDEGLADLYRASSVYVSASKGEGWGFHPHQSLGCGRPVVAPIVGGHAEFLDESCAWPVEWDAVPCDPANPHYGGLGEWFLPRMASLRAAMRAAFADPAARRRKGEAGVKAAHRFTWERAGRELYGVLDQHGLIPLPAHVRAHQEAPAPPAPHLPSWGARAGTLARAVIRHAGAGFPMADAAERDRRAAICGECPELLPPNTYQRCGCNLTTKRSMATERCPGGRW